MKTFADNIKSFTKETLTKTTFTFAIFTLLVFCSIAHGDIGLTANGNDPAVLPLQLESYESIEITLIDPNSEGSSYDLTLSVTGGVFSCEDPDSYTSSESTIDIQTSNLDTLGNISFNFQEGPGMAVIQLTTNQALTIGEQTVPAGTVIYRLVLFDMTDVEKVVVFGVNYNFLSYEPPVQEESISQSIESEAFESMGLGGGDSMMMSMESQQFEHVSFANAAECPDLDDDNFVNLKDFAIFSGNWLENGSGLDGDFDEDGTVDLDDLAHMTTYWLHEVCAVTYVDGSASGGDGSSWASPYENLQDALNNVQSGDEIWVAEGIYYPDEGQGERTSTFQLIEGVAVYGGFDPDGGDDEWAERNPAANVTTLSGDIGTVGTDDTDNCYHVVTGADNAILDGFTITGGYADDSTIPDERGAGILNENVSPIISNCVIRENEADFAGGGVYNWGDSEANSAETILINCLLFENKAAYGGAVFSEGYTSDLIENCTFSKNNASGEGGAIYDYSNYTVTNIENSILWGDTDSTNDWEVIANASTINISYSGFDENKAGVVNGGDVDYDNSGNVYSDPLFADADNDVFHLKAPAGRWNGSSWVTTDLVISPCIDTGDPSSVYSNEPTPNGSRINMGVYGNTTKASKSNTYVYVSTSGSDSTGNGTIGNPYATIQKGINMVTDGGSVIVTGGLFNERFSFTSGHKGLTLRATGPCIISGQNGGSVFSFSGVSSSITIENFTIQDGKTINGGGAYVYNSNNIAFVNCDFEDNQAYYTSGQARGGAVYISNCSPSFDYCEFDNNQAYGASGGQYNLGYGGAIYTNNATATFDYCTIGTNSALNNSSSDEVYTNSIDGGRPTYSNCGIRGGWLGSYMQSNPIPPIDGGGNYTL